MKDPSPLPPLNQAFSHFMEVNFSSSVKPHSFTPDLIKELTSQLRFAPQKTFGINKI